MKHLVSKFRASSFLRIAAITGLGLTASGCVYDGSLGLGYASDGYDSGYGCDGYNDFDSYYGCDSGYGFSNIGYGGGWYSNYYYPGYGYFVFDRYGRRYQMHAIGAVSGITGTVNMAEDMGAEMGMVAVTAIMITMAAVIITAVITVAEITIMAAADTMEMVMAAIIMAETAIMATIITVTLVREYWMAALAGVVLVPTIGAGVRTRIRFQTMT
jgi:hypothetical protein